jgi:hypothetical protein
MNESGLRAQILRLAIKIRKAKSSIVFFAVNLKDRAGAIILADRLLDIHVRVAHDCINEFLL